MPYLAFVSTRSVVKSSSISPGEEITLPFARPENAGESAIFEGVIRIPPLASSDIDIVPDDCLTSLEIAGESLPLTQWGRATCDWNKGVHVDLRNWRGSGLGWSEIPFTVSVNNNGGSMGLRVRSSRSATLLSLPFLVPLLVALMALAAILLRKGLSAGVSAMIIFGLILRWAYLVSTNFQERAHDVAAHISYIQHLSAQGTLPSIASGWAFFQPPLYYALMALVHRMGGEGEATYLVMQLCSLLCSGVLLVAGAVLFQRVFPRGNLSVLLIALLAAWPALIIHSVRISNDPLLHCLSAVGLVLLLRWYDLRQRRDLYVVAILAGLAVLTKANGITLFASLITIYLSAELSSRSYPTWGARVGLLKRTALLSLPFAAASLVTFGRGVLAHLSDPKVDWLVGQAFNWMNNRLLVSNTPFEYFYFDLQTFLKVPFLNPWLDESGRQFFWNYVLKSSLFGEFSFAFRGASTLALVLSALVVAIVLYVVLYVMTLRKADFRRVLPYLLALGIQIGFLLLFRIGTPVSGNADFRYVAPLLLPLFVLFGLSLKSLMEHDRFVLARLGSAAALLLVGCSGVFFLLLIAGS